MLPREGQSVARVEIRTETETDRGWLFAVEITLDDAGERVHHHELTLSWPDYEYWSHGMRSPSAVAEAVCRGLLELRPGLAWPEKFDASTARRWAQDLDLRVRESI